MSDKAFLYWLHQRLLNIHKEPLEVDYMNKLRSIILSLDKDRYTPNIVTTEEFDRVSQILQTEIL